MPDTGIPIGPLPFRMLIDEAAKLTRKSLRSIYVPVAIPIAGIQAVFSVVQLRWMEGWLTATQSADPAAMFSSFVPFFLFSMGFGVLIGLVYVTMYASCVDVVAGRELDIPSRVRFVVRLRVLFTLLFAGFCVMAGLAACILPGLIAGLLLSFLIPVMVEEKQYLIDAISRSGSIATFNARRSPVEAPMVKVFILGIISVILSYALALLVQVPIAIVQQILLFREIADGGTLGAVPSMQWMWLQVPAQIVGSLGTTVVNLYVAFGIALLYFDVRRRKEGSDIEAALDKLLAAP